MLQCRVVTPLSKLFCGIVSEALDEEKKAPLETIAAPSESRWGPRADGRNRALPLRGSMNGGLSMCL